MKLARTVNCRKDPYDIFIGRPSKWGNPFIIGRHGSRTDVVEAYHRWFLSQTDLLDSLNELKGKTLGCFCYPKRCHGDILEFYVNNPKRVIEDRKDWKRKNKE